MGILFWIYCGCYISRPAKIIVLDIFLQVPCIQYINTRITCAFFAKKFQKEVLKSLIQRRTVGMERVLEACAT